MAAEPTIGPRRTLAPPGRDELEAEREQAERDNFAALIQASRQNAQNDETPPETKTRRVGSPWIVSVLILAVAIALIWLERENIMRAWPPSARVLGNLGMIWTDISLTAGIIFRQH